MHAVVSEQPPEIVSALVANGALIDAQDPEGKTALMLAALNNNDITLYELLLELHADVTIIDNDGITAEHYAIYNECSSFEEYFKAFSYKEEVQLLYDLYDDSDARNWLSSLMQRWKLIGDEKASEDRLTPLMVAAEYEPAKVVSLLIDRGADVNFVSENGEQALSLAITENDDVDVTRLLVEATADLDYKDDEQRNLLEIAILYSSSESTLGKVNVLIENGISLEGEYERTREALLKDFADMFGEAGEVEINNDVSFDDIQEHLIGSPAIILAAACTSQTDVLEVLLEAGADIDAQDYTFGKTAVMWAIERFVYEGNIKPLELLIVRGADLFKEDAAGRTGWRWVYDNLDQEDLKHILGILPDINARDDKNFATALSAAVQLPDDASDIIKLLLEYGADLHTEYGQGFSILMVAVLWGVNIKNIQALTEVGTLINATNNYDRTPLHMSVKGLNPAVVQLLLDAGSDVTLKDYLDYTSLMYLIAIYADIVKDLGGIDVSIEERTLKIIEMLTARDTHENLQEYISSVEFWELLNKRKRMKVDNVAFIKLFIDAGANINSMGIEDGTTPFMKACEKCKDIDVIKWLLEKGADVNLKDSEGLNSIGHAVLGGSPIKVLKVLVAAGADLNTKTKTGITLLELATSSLEASKSKDRIINFLAKEGEKSEA